MIKNIVLPLDGSFSSERVIPWVEDYASRSGSKVSLVRAIPSSGLWVEGDHIAGRQRDDARRYLDEVAERLALKNIKCATYVRSGRPASVIVKIAANAHADMIALTTRGSTTVTRGFFGGTAERILRRSPTAVFILHASQSAPGTIGRILVPLDGTEVSESILSSAATLARLHESKLVLAYVRPYRAIQSLDTNRMERLCENLTLLGVPSTYTWAVGDPSPTLLRLARVRNIGMIAMNSARRNLVSRLIWGSVAQAVVRGADVPVFVTHYRQPMKLTTDQWIKTGDVAFA